MAAFRLSVPLSPSSGVFDLLPVATRSRSVAVIRPSGGCEGGGGGEGANGRMNLVPVSRRDRPRSPLLVRRRLKYAVFPEDALLQGSVVLGGGRMGTGEVLAPSLWLLSGRDTPGVIRYKVGGALGSSS